MRRRKRLDKRKFLRFLGVLVLVVVFVSGIVCFGIDRVFSGNEDDDDQTTDSQGISLDNVPNLEKRVSVLLIGADQRPGETSFNTDTLIVASIDPDTKRICLLSIPRDTLVSLPGSPYLKINSVYRLAGMDTLKQKVTELTGIPLAGYVLTNFSGFKDIIDILGGIEIDVEFDMYKETGDKEDGVIDLKKGRQVLDGAKALQYARYRDDALADIARTSRQQKVLKAVADKMMQVSTIPKLPWLIPKISEMVETDLSLRDMFKIAKAAVGFSSENVVSTTLPGGFKDIDGVSYWEVIPENAKKAVEDLLNGIVPSAIQDVIDHIPQPIVTKPSTPSPSVPETPVVPGGPHDPNGTDSPGHEGRQGGQDQAGGNNDSPPPGNDDPGGTSGPGDHRDPPPGQGGETSPDPGEDNGSGDPSEPDGGNGTQNGSGSGDQSPPGKAELIQ